jgi:hypothetical protein
MQETLACFTSLRSGSPTQITGDNELRKAAATFKRNDLVALAEKATTFGVADLNVPASKLTQHHSTDLPSERTSVFPEEVLRANRDSCSGEDVTHLRDNRHGGQNEDVGCTVDNRLMPPRHLGDLAAPLECLLGAEIHLEADA